MHVVCGFKFVYIIMISITNELLDFFFISNNLIFIILYMCVCVCALGKHTHTISKQWI